MVVSNMPVVVALLLAALSPSAIVHAQQCTDSPRSSRHDARPTSQARLGLDAEVRPGRSVPTRTATGTLVQLNGSQSGALGLLEDDRGRVHPFKLTQATRLSADKKVEGVDRKHLSLANYSAGRTVRLTFRESDSTATELQLRPAPVAR